MPTRWETFPIQCTGGLVSNISPIQQGMDLINTARYLINFEESIEGGYRRIEGYEKYDDNTIPPYGEPLVQDGGQTGTSLDIANIHKEPAIGDTFTIDGVTGTYEISAVSYSGPNKSATLTLTSSLASSPADQAAITFTNNENVINGLAYLDQVVYAARGADFWKSSGAGWTKINIPSYGTVEVDGGSQTGTSLDVDGLTGIPQAGDTFTIDSVDLVYTVTADATVTSGAATLAINPALDSSPANNASITWLTTDVASDNKYRFDTYDFGSGDFVIGVNGTGKPFKFNNTSFEVLTGAPSDIDGADHVAVFQNHLFLARDTVLSFGAPLADDDFTPANGAGVINLKDDITGLIVFRDQLIIFTVNEIHRLSGSSFANFTVDPIATDLGCLFSDTIQEVGGDIMFMAADGVRFLSATERNNDFGLAVASRAIQEEVNYLKDNFVDMCSMVIREKNQYRVYGYDTTFGRESSRGIIAVQRQDQTSQGISWSETRGIKAYTAYSTYCGVCQAEVYFFAGNTGYVYSAETGNDFDGNPIPWSYWTPFYSMNDPRYRKSFYKVTVYLDPEGSIMGTLTPKLDLDGPGVIQPPSIGFSNSVAAGGFWGQAVWGNFNWGGSVTSLFYINIVGTGKQISLEFDGNDDDTPPFSFDTILIDFMVHDKQ